MSFVTLVKLSSPGWEKKFNNPEEFKAELWKHICGICRRGYEDPEDIARYGAALTENSFITDMWATGCGCEYDIEDPHGLLTPLS